MELVLWIRIMQQVTQQDMRSTLEVPTLFTLKSMQTDFLFHQQEFQEIAINWHVTLDNQALTVAVQQEQQTEIMFVYVSILLFVLSLLAKIPFVNQSDKQERGQLEIFNQVAMSQSFQIVMMRMFVLSILAIQHGQELIHQVWDAFTPQTLQIAIQTTFASLGDAMQQQVVSRMQSLWIQTQLVSDTIAILWMDQKLFNNALKVVLLQTNVWFHIVILLLEQMEVARPSILQLWHTVLFKVIQTLVETIFKWLVVCHQLTILIAFFTIAIQPPEIASKTILVNVFKIVIVLTTLVVPSTLASISLANQWTLIVIQFSQMELVLWTRPI
jgi:hypothetical protein